MKFLRHVNFRDFEVHIFRDTYSATRLTVATQQTFLQVYSRNIIICLMNTPSYKVECDQIDACYITFINKRQWKRKILQDDTCKKVCWVATVRRVAL